LQTAKSFSGFEENRPPKNVEQFQSGWYRILAERITKFVILSAARLILPPLSVFLVVVFGYSRKVLIKRYFQK